MQRVRAKVLHNSVQNGRTGEVVSAEDEDNEIVLPEHQAEWLGDQVSIVGWIDEAADADMDGVPDGLDQRFDAAEFVDQDYEVVVQTIERGAVDDHLEAVWQADVEERDGRVYVQEALRERGYDPDRQPDQQSGV